MAVQPIDTDALEQDAWLDFERQLARQLAGLWPAMEGLLGQRYETFVQLAVEQAGKLGLWRAASVARYVNLCFVWGPGFQDKAGFGWALETFSKSSQQDWQSMHQLVQRSLLELQQLPGSKVEPQALLAADTALLNAFEGLGRRGAMLDKSNESQQLPRHACDLEAVELRLLDEEDEAGTHQEYRLEGDGWQRSKRAAPEALRISVSRPLPPLVAVLSAQKAQGRAARLQLRARSHAVCDADIHPALAFSGPIERWDWAGHETRTLSWPVQTREQPESKPGPGCVIAEETSPELHKLELTSCGLRDTGEALGSLQTLVYAWPAAQWWLEIQRARPQAEALQTLLPGSPGWARAVSRCRIERDGQAQDSAALLQQFELGLDGAAAEGLQKLATAWAQTPGLADARFEASLGLLVGNMAGTWGWRLGAAGLAGRALMRLVALLEMDACSAQLVFEGELALAGSSTRIRLRCAGRAEMHQRIQYEEAGEPSLDEMLRKGVVSWRFPFELSLASRALDSGCLLEQVGPVSGALIGEAGLRPNSKGGSGFEWFVGLRVEAVVASVQWADPLLGHALQQLPLLPAMPLLDWSVG